MPKQFWYQPWLNSPIESPTLLNLLGLSNIHMLSCYYSLANTRPVESPPMQQLLWRPPDSQGRDWVFMESFPPSRLSSYIYKTTIHVWVLSISSTLPKNTHHPFDLPGECSFLYHTIIEHPEVEGAHKDHQSPTAGPAQGSPKNPPCAWARCLLSPAAFCGGASFLAEKLLLKSFSSIASCWVLTNFTGLQMGSTVVQVHYSP